MPRSTDPVARLLAAYEVRFDQGDRAALFEALDVVARTGSPMPPWVAVEFIRCWETWLRYEVRSLDEAFRIGRVKGARLGDRAHRLRLAVPVLFRIEERRRAGKSVDRAMFEEVGEEHGICRRTCERIYAEYRNLRTMLRLAEELLYRT